jgi:hypothetical protein
VCNLGKDACTLISHSHTRRSPKIKFHALSCETDVSHFTHESFTQKVEEVSVGKFHFGRVQFALEIWELKDWHSYWRRMLHRVS